MIILGLDPGTATTGYGVIEAKGNKNILLGFGCIKTPAHTPLARRLNQIYSGLNQLLDHYQPQQVAIEQLFFNSNTKTAISVAQARGVMVLAVEQRDLPIGEYTPLQVKSSIIGYGRAEKTQIKYMVAKLLKMPQKPISDDAADALAIALCHAHYYHTRGLR